ncbi:MAG: hypothetical protein ABSF26_28735 [Thermoguttaceae bacterium]|jgi:hypothetical protein
MMHALYKVPVQRAAMGPGAGRKTKGHEYRPPLMNYVTLNCVGFNPDKVKEGYFDGVDVGVADKHAKYVYKTGNNLAKKKIVSASVLPNTGEKSLSALVDEWVTQNFFQCGARWTKGTNASDNWAVAEVRVWEQMKKTRWAHDNFEHDKMRDIEPVSDMGKR